MSPVTTRNRPGSCTIPWTAIPLIPFRSHLLPMAQNHAGHEGGEKSSIVLYRGLAVKRDCGIRFMKYPPLTMNATLKCSEAEAGYCLDGCPIRGVMEVYNDFNSNLTNLYSCVKNHTMDFLRLLGFLPLNSREEFLVLRRFLETVNW